MALVVVEAREQMRRQIGLLLNKVMRVGGGRISTESNYVLFPLMRTTLYRLLNSEYLWDGSPTGRFTNWTAQFAETIFTPHLTLPNGNL